MATGNYFLILHIQRVKQRHRKKIYMKQKPLTYTFIIGGLFVGGLLSRGLMSGGLLSLNADLLRNFIMINVCKIDWSVDFI